MRVEWRTGFYWIEGGYVRDLGHTMTIDRFHFACVLFQTRLLIACLNSLLNPYSPFLLYPNACLPTQMQDTYIVFSLFLANARLLLHAARILRMISSKIIPFPHPKAYKLHYTGNSSVFPSNSALNILSYYACERERGDAENEIAYLVRCRWFVYFFWVYKKAG